MVSNIWSGVLPLTSTESAGVRFLFPGCREAIDATLFFSIDSREHTGSIEY